jgi:hypothetical protein
MLTTLLVIFICHAAGLIVHHHRCKHGNFQPGTAYLV